MPSVTSGWRLIGFAVALAVGCSQSGGAEKFGTWTYAGSIDPNCMNIAAIDLTGDKVTITAPDSSHLVVDLAGFCTVHFNVDGFTASAAANQTCTFDIPMLGPEDITITKWTLTVTTDSVLASNFAGAVLICAPTGMGTLTRIGDAGAVDHDAGATD
jgi:hypothetical protein